MKQLMVVVCCLFLVGCDNLPFIKNYELTVKDDALIRFNKQTGEILLIEDGNVWRIDEEFINNKIRSTETKKYIERPSKVHKQSLN